MRRFLVAAGLWEIFVPWTGAGKPPADLYVDNLSWAGRIARRDGWSRLVDVLGA